MCMCMRVCMFEYPVFYGFPCACVRASVRARACVCMCYVFLALCVYPFFSPRRTDNGVFSIQKKKNNNWSGA